MPVQITISGEDAGEALRDLTTLTAALNGQASQPVAAPPQETAAPQQEAEKPKRQSRTTKQEPEPSKAEQPKEEPAATPAPAKESEGSDDQTDEPSADEPNTEGGDGAPVPDIAEIRALASEKAKSAGKEKVKGLLDDFACKSVSDIPVEKRAAFMAALGNL